MYDHWGNAMGVSGGTRSFALSVGGAASPMAANECSALANRMTTIASTVSVGSTAAVGTGASAGRVTEDLPSSPMEPSARPTWAPDAHRPALSLQWSFASGEFPYEPLPWGIPEGVVCKAALRSVSCC